MIFFAILAQKKKHIMKTRRKAVKAELLRESKDHPGYFKYKVTIEEVDGTVHDVPAYGKDMQDAISRLVWTERVDKVTSKKGIMPIFAGLLLAVVALSGMIAVTKNNPLWIVGGLAIGVLSLVISNVVNNYLHKE
jgi:hypothetical protein